jgi:GT2 family glycosyltransferase
MHTDTPELSILLVNWNTREMTLECLRSVFSETLHTSFEVILVDNASSDGSAEAIAAEFPEVILMAEAINHGFGRATNIQALKARGEKLLLLNTDTVVLEGAIDALMDFSRRRPDAMIWGGRTLFGNRTLNPTSCWTRSTPWNQLTEALCLSALFPKSRLLNPRTMPGWARDCEREVDIVTGCLLLIGRDLWGRLGGFNPRYFMYGEEVDLCLRARRLGARPAITPNATIIHYGGGSTTNSSEKICRGSAAQIQLALDHFPVGLKRVGRRLIMLGVANRTIGWQLAAWLRPGRFGAKALAWRSAWKRRSEWASGYPTVLSAERMPAR